MSGGLEYRKEDEGMARRKKKEYTQRGFNGTEGWRRPKRRQIEGVKRIGAENLEL